MVNEMHSSRTLRRLLQILAMCFCTLTLLSCLPWIEQRTISKVTIPLSLKWTYGAPDAILNPPVIVGDLVLVKTNALLIAVNRMTGKQTWSIPARTMDIPPRPFQWANKTVIFESDFNTTIRAVNVFSGTEIWARGWKGIFDEQITAYTLDGLRAYVARGRPARIRAYSLEDGSISWESGSLNYSAGTVSARGNELFVLDGGSLHVLDTETGTIKRMLESKFLGRYVTLVNKDICLVDQGFIESRDSDSGSIRWQIKGDAQFFTVINGIVYAVSEDGILLAIDEVTGKLLWQYRSGIGLISRIAHMSQTGYVMLANGSLLAFDLITGEETGRLETDPKNVSPYFPAYGLDANDQTLVVAFGDTKLFAFGK